MWQAWRIPGELYVIGNDLKQADNRMNQFIRYNLENSPPFKNYFSIVRYEIDLDNNSKIHAIPVDPEGEAGMNPTGLFWTEAWGAKHAKHELLWTEAALSPQRAGQSFKFIESYAGYKNTSMILWRLYDSIWQEGEPVPVDYLRKLCNQLESEQYEMNLSDNDLALLSDELRTKDNAIAWWCTRPVLPAQMGDSGQRYYATQSATLLPAEYDRQHRNQWADALQSFVAIEAWDACQGELPPVSQYEVQVLAIDASVSGDCTAVVSVSRRGEMVYIRAVKVWQPERGQKIDYADVEKWIVDYKANNRVACIVYDPYQMEYMAERLIKSGHWVEPFNQGAMRLKGDKSLHDRIINQKIMHDGDPTLKQHILNANAKIDSEEGKLRIVKANEQSKVDALVALSMAAYTAETLDIG